MKTKLIVRNCPRCGKQTTGTTKPIHGDKKGHAKFAGLCSGCVTVEEQQEILEGQARAIVGRGK